MDFDSSSKFVASLAKFLQSLCNGYVDFDKGVEVIGHIHINVDSDLGKKVDYVLNERVCKNNNSITFISNSFPAQPAEKPPPPPKEPEPERNESEQSVVMDDSGQAVPSSTNVGTLGSYRHFASRTNSNDGMYNPGSKRPKSPHQRRGMGSSSNIGSPYNKHGLPQSPRFQDSSGPSAKMSRTDYQRGSDSSNYYQSGGDEDDYTANYDSPSAADQKPIIDPDLGIVKEEHRLAANQYSGHERVQPQTMPQYQQSMNQSPSNYAGAPQRSQMDDSYSTSLSEGGADPSTLTQAQREELEMYYRKGTDQHLTFLRNMREAHAMYPFTGKRDKELFDKALAELIRSLPLLRYDQNRLSQVVCMRAAERRYRSRKTGQFKSPGGRGGRQQYYQQMQQYQQYGASYLGTPGYSGQADESFDYTQEDSRDTQHSFTGSGGDQSQPAGFHGAFTNNGAGGPGSSSGNTGGTEGNGQHKTEPPDIKPTLPPMPFMSGGEFELIEIEEDDEDI